MRRKAPLPNKKKERFRVGVLGLPGLESEATARRPWARD